MLLPRTESIAARVAAAGIACFPTSLFHPRGIFRHGFSSDGIERMRDDLDDLTASSPADASGRGGVRVARKRREVSTRR